LLRLEEGLRVQREQRERRRFSEPEAASSRPESPSGRQGSTQIEPISENAHGDKTRYMVNVPTEETRHIAFFAKESRGDAVGGNSQMGRTYTDEGNVPVNALPTLKRARRSFTRFLLAIGIGVAATLAWQSYGETTKQIIGRRAPQLGWSPEAKQMIASLVRQLGWIPDAPRPAPVAQTAPATAAPIASAAPSPDLQQVQQIARDLAKVRQAVEQLPASRGQMAGDIAKVRQAVEQLAASQGQMAGDIAKVQAADQEILQRISAPRPRPATVPAHTPTPVRRPSSRPPIPLH
jgi:hypothetical protein